MGESLELLITRDGSRTLYSPRYQQSFHSMHGALTESRHVFLEGAEIKPLFTSSHKAVIMEIGFGAGLNWLLTASLALRHDVRLSYIGVDLHVPRAEILSELHYGDVVEFTSLSDSFLQWRNTLPGRIPDGSYQLSHIQKSTLHLEIGDATGISPKPCSCDRIYLDGFDSKMNPELWTSEFIQRLYDALRPAGILATYSAAGHVRRALIASGFSVTRRPGPPGKREVLAAHKPATP